MLSNQSCDKFNSRDNQLSAILSRGWQPPPSPIPPDQYDSASILLLPSANAFITSSQLVFGSLWHISITVFVKDNFVDIKVLYVTFINSAFSIVVSNTGAWVIVL